jgi:electron-transferring-flavoprotein dehydrogenase
MELVFLISVALIVGLASAIRLR